MAAFCHPHQDGGRFTTSDVGGWYAAVDLETAHRETTNRRAEELREVGAVDLVVQVRDYLADFDCPLHDVRNRDQYVALYDPASHEVSQRFAHALREAGSNGIYYCSVRRPGGECLVAYKPQLVLNVRQAGHYEYKWSGAAGPSVRLLTDAP